MGSERNGKTCAGLTRGGWPCYWTPVQSWPGEDGHATGHLCRAGQGTMALSLGTCARLIRRGWPCHWTPVQGWPGEDGRVTGHLYRADKERMAMSLDTCAGLTKKGWLCHWTPVQGWPGNNGLVTGHLCKADQERLTVSLDTCAGWPGEDGPVTGNRKPGPQAVWQTQGPLPRLSPSPTTLHPALCLRGVSPQLRLSPVRFDFQALAAELDSRCGVGRGLMSHLNVLRAGGVKGVVASPCYPYQLPSRQEPQDETAKPEGVQSGH